MAQRFHPVIQHARDDHPFLPLSELAAKVVEDMRGRPATVRSELDMKGPDAGCELISLTRARTFRILGDRSDCPRD